MHKKYGLKVGISRSPVLNFQVDIVVRSRKLSFTAVITRL